MRKRSEEQNKEIKREEEQRMGWIEGKEKEEKENEEKEETSAERPWLPVTMVIFLIIFFLTLIFNYR